jgi:hypothetical protein
MKSRAAGVCVTLGVAVLGLVLSGCVVSSSGPSYTDLRLGTVRVAQSMTASTTVAPQQLDEYGLFYSTNREDVVNIDANEFDGFDSLATIVTNPDVKQVRVITSVAIQSDESGVPTVDAKNLTPGTTYYYRFYTIGRDSTGTTWRTLFEVGSHKTSNPTLASLKKSAGALAPAFSKMRFGYTDTLSASTSSSKITVVPALSSSHVRMRIDAGAWSNVRNKVVSVSKGHNKTLYIEVTATDGGVAIYTVKVVRKK